MRRNIFPVGITATIFALTIGHAAVGVIQTEEDEEALMRVPVKTLEFPNIPVSFSSATAVRVNNRIVLSYSITSRTAEQLTGLHIRVFVIDRFGHIKAGEGWVTNVDLEAHSTEDLARYLKSEVSPGDKLVLAVSKVVGPVKTFEVDASELLNAVKSCVRVNRVVKSSFSGPSCTSSGYSAAIRRIAYAQGESFCDRALRLARETCECGVASFSCNEKEQSYSFTCFQCYV